MSNFKLIQLGYGLFGEGETVDQAKIDAKEWLDDPSSLDRVEYYDNAALVNKNCVHGDLVVVPSDVAEEFGNYE